MRRIEAWLPYALAGILAVVLVVVSVSRSDPSKASKALGGQQLKIMAPADPGGGWDSTAREMQSSLQDIVGRSEVYNVGGGGGTIGLSQFEQMRGQPNQLMVMGLVMVGAIAANKSAVTLKDVTPIASLTTEPQLIVVPAKSDVKDLGQLVQRMKQDLTKVSWAGGSAGGAEQILTGLMAQSLKLNPKQVNYIAHSGGGETVATLLSGSATAGIASVSEFQPLIRAGKLRPIAVSAAERVPSLKDTPTLKEGGVNVVLTNWRGVVAPPGISAKEQEVLVKMIKDMTESGAWKKAMKREGWDGDVRLGKDFKTYLDSEITRVDKVVSELGIGQGA